MKIFSFHALRQAFTERFKCEQMAYIAFTVTIAAFASVILIALVNQRTFIPDEAWIAENLVTRPFSLLFAEPFINEQTAPALYSLITKACWALLGYSPFGSRLLSSLAWLSVLTVALTLLRFSFGLTRVWSLGGIALLSSMPMVLRYGTPLLCFSSVRDNPNLRKEVTF